MKPVNGHTVRSSQTQKWLQSLLVRLLNPMLELVEMREQYLGSGDKKISAVSTQLLQFNKVYVYFQQLNVGQGWNITDVDLGLVSNVVRNQHLQDSVLRDATVLKGLRFMMENAFHQLHVHVSTMEKSFQQVQKLNRIVITGNRNLNLNLNLNLHSLILVNVSILSGNAPKKCVERLVQLQETLTTLHLMDYTMTSGDSVPIFL